VSMPATTQGDRGPLQAAPPQGREGIRTVLLTCGPVSGLVYLGWPEPAGLPWTAAVAPECHSRAVI
jgi:hypothetical protein